MKKRVLLRPTSHFVPAAMHEYTFQKRYRAIRQRKNLGKKQKIKGDYNLVDRISVLPDDLVSSIVSCLPLKEAAATSILSMRWKHVWKYSASLNFDVKFGVGKSLVRFRQLKKEEMDQESRRYVNWVDSVMDKHRAPTVERFRVCFDIDRRFTTSVDRWIEFAMNKRVQILELEFFREYSMLDPEGIYPFPHKLLGLEKESGLKVKHLDSSGTPSLHFCRCNVGFNLLKVLHFKGVDVTQEVLEYFLSNCPDLERVTVDCVRSLVNFRIAGPSIALKYLVLRNCYGLKSVQICDANLVSLSIFGLYEIKLLLSNVPSLVEVSYNIIQCTFMDLAHVLTQLSCCTHLQMLMLNINRVDCNQSHVFPTFANLKHLELIVEQDCDRALRNLISFLKASPYLQRLVLKLKRCFLRSCKCIGKIRKIAHCPHYYLKVVEIEGYRGSTSVKHVMYLINNVVALEKIVIKPIHNPSLSKEDTEKEEVRARNHAMQRLKGKVPSSIEFVCM